MKHVILATAVAGLVFVLSGQGFSQPAHCPPGLAKKGCVPPGQAKKRYQVGHPLPTGVTYRPAPREVVVRLDPPPSGHVYGYVDGDLLLIAEATRRVIDAVIAVDAATRGTRR